MPELLMPFLTDSKMFVYGFECGQIWELLQANAPIQERIIHTINSEQIKEMASRQNVHSFFIRRIDDTWSELTVRYGIS